MTAVSSCRVTFLTGATYLVVQNTSTYLVRGSWVCEFSGPEPEQREGTISEEKEGGWGQVRMSLEELKELQRDGHGRTLTSADSSGVVTDPEKEGLQRLRQPRARRGGLAGTEPPAGGQVPARQ